MKLSFRVQALLVVAGGAVALFALSGLTVHQPTPATAPTVQRGFVPPDIRHWEPPPKGSLPKECQPHEVPEYRELTDDEKPEMEGERIERMRCGERVYANGRREFSSCSPFGFMNAQYYADSVGGHGYDCSGPPPYTADWIQCETYFHDQWHNKRAIEKLRCRGDKPLEDGSGCVLVKKVSVYEEAPELDKKASKKIEEEMRQKREARFQLCRKWCARPEFKDKCSKYWAVR